VDFVLKAEKLERDLERLSTYESYTRYLRDEYMDYVEFQDHGLDLIPPEDIVGYKIRYKSDEAEVVGFISAPADYLSKRYPVLIYNRGGHSTLALNEAPKIDFLAQFGFIVLASQYRGTDGGTGKDEYGGADVNDVIKLIDLAEMFSFANGKVYMFGWSRGAMQTYIALSVDTRIHAAVSGAGPTDLYLLHNERESALKRILHDLVGTPGTSPEKYRARSAIYWPEKINTPLWIVHGTADDRALVHHSQDLYDAMTKLGKDVKLTLYPDMDHGLPYYAFLSDYLYWLKQH